MYTARHVELGTKVRELLADKGYVSVAAPGFEATSIVAMHATTPEQANGSTFKQAGAAVFRCRSASLRAFHLPHRSVRLGQVG